MRFVGLVALVGILTLGVAAPAAASPREHLDVFVDARSWGTTFVEACAYIPAADDDDWDEWVDLTSDPRLERMRAELPAVLGLPPADRTTDCVVWDGAALQVPIDEHSRAVTISTTGLPVLGERHGFGGVRVSLCVPPVQVELTHDRGEAVDVGETTCEWTGWEIVGTDVSATATFGADDGFLRTRALAALGPLVLWVLLCAGASALRGPLAVWQGERIARRRSLAAALVITAFAPALHWLFVAEGAGFIDAVVLRTGGGETLDRLLFFGPLAAAVAVAWLSTALVWSTARRHVRSSPPETTSTAPPPLPARLVRRRHRLQGMAFAHTAPVAAIMLVLSLGREIPPPIGAATLLALGLAGVVVLNPLLQRASIRLQRPEPLAEPLASEVRHLTAAAGVRVDRVLVTSAVPLDATGDDVPVVLLGRTLLMWEPIADLDASALATLAADAEGDRAFAWWAWWATIPAAAGLAAWQGQPSLAGGAAALAVLLAVSRGLAWRARQTPISPYEMADEEAGLRAAVWSVVHQVRALAATDPPAAAEAWGDRLELFGPADGPGPLLERAELERRFADALARSVERRPPDAPSPSTVPLQPA